MADTEKEKIELLNAPKPWEEEQETIAMKKVVAMSEYPNYFLHRFDEVCWHETTCTEVMSVG